MAAISSDSTDNITVRTIEVQSNRERYAYLFMRLSGVGLLVLAVGHMVIQHILNSSANLTIQFVANTHANAVEGLADCSIYISKWPPGPPQGQ